MAHRRPRGRGISESQRRKKTWISVKTQIPGTTTDSESLFVTANKLETATTGGSPGAVASSVFALISDQFSGLGDEASTLPEECTILRARGSLVFPQSSPGAGPIVEGQYAFGMGVTDIRGLTGASTPGPIVDSDWDGWMFLRQSSIGPLTFASAEVDIKAMRKIKTGDALFFAAQAVNGNDVAALAGGEWVFDMRLLILLP